eukprot:COSAG04_NODE_1075_length_8444_cov_1.922229_12_plen_58_part_00
MAQYDCTAYPRQLHLNHSTMEFEHCCLRCLKGSVAHIPRPWVWEEKVPETHGRGMLK